MTDYSLVPIPALSVDTKQVISILLNAPKVLPSENGLPRDWRGLAHALGIPGETMPLLASEQNPSNHIFELIKTNSSRKVTFKDLLDALKIIERWDVFDDIEQLIENDAKEYIAGVERSKTSAEPISANSDSEILTIDDQHRFKEGLKSQNYDAFLLYADEDFDFAKEMLERLEEKNLKICIKDRDLLFGITLEHKAIMELISERCNRLIVIISPHFLKSSANNFFLAFAQAVGIDKQQRKLIPCIYKECDIPHQLSYTNKLFYNRRAYFDFWGQLICSVQNTETSLLEDRRIKQFNKDLEELKKVVENCELKNQGLTSLRDDCNQDNSIEDNEDNAAFRDRENNSIINDDKSPDLVQAETSKKNNIMSIFGKKTVKKTITPKSSTMSSEEIDLHLPSVPSDMIDLLSTSSSKKKKMRKKSLKDIVYQIPSLLKFKSKRNS